MNIYLNGKIIPPSEGLISVYDHGFLYGAGVYETLRIYNGTAFKLKEHIDRLFRSASFIKLNIGKTHEQIVQTIYQLLDANQLKNAVVRISISRGVGPIGLDPALCKEPTIVMMTYPFDGHPIEHYENGVYVAITKVRRNYKGALDPMIKSLNFLNNILAKIESIEANAFEPLMLNHQGYIAEGAITNVFFIREKTLYTPSVDVGILDGITRSTLMGLALKQGLKVVEGHFRKEEIYSADEIFLSNTTMEVMPVRKIDDKIIKNTPGPYTKELHQVFKDYVVDHCYRHRRQ
jgi:branched-chain amino acid aminotransferase